MKTIRKWRSMVFGALCLLTLLEGGLGTATAQEVSRRMPENARSQSYGSGWECKPGYREVNRACTAIKVPAHAFATDVPYGSGWGCERGYSKRHESCVAITVPANAYLDSVRTVLG